MDLRQLRHALALGEHRSFGRAADSLHITQSALSRSIQSLEAQAGVRLFDRGARNVEPTFFGRLLLEHARRLDLAARDLDRELQLAQGLESGSLIVGAGPFGGAPMVGAVVGRLIEKHPKLRTRIVIAPWQEMPERLRARDIDLMVAEVHALGAHEEFESRPLARHPLYVVGRPGHPLAKAGPIGYEEIFRYPIVGAQPFHGDFVATLKEAPPEFLATLVASGEMAATCDSTQVLFDILRVSNALSAMCLFMMADAVEAGTLAVLPQFDLGRPLRFTVAWLRGRTLSPPAQAFVDQLVAYDLEMVAREESLLARLSSAR